MKRPDGSVLAAGAAVVSFCVLYWPTLRRLAQDWLTDDNYSHGLLIVPLSLYFAWERRGRLQGLERRPAAAGFLIVVVGLLLLTAGLLGAELFLSRVSLLFVIAGTVLFMLGWPALRVLAFPIVFLLLMIPIPSIVFNEVAFPLQMAASRAGQAGLEAVGIPVLREGNVIVLAHTTLEVAEACSGIRSLISLLTIGIVFGYFTDPRASVRWLIALSAIPVAVLTNGARVAGTGIAAHMYGREAADGFFHTFSGWLVFAAAFIAIVAVARLLLRIAPLRAAQPSVPARPLKAGV